MPNKRKKGKKMIGVWLNVKERQALSKLAVRFATDQSSAIKIAVEKASK